LHTISDHKQRITRRESYFKFFCRHFMNGLNQTFTTFYDIPCKVRLRETQGQQFMCVCLE
jgi:hypothetical protein